VRDWKWLAAGSIPAGLFAWGAYHPASRIFGPTVRHTDAPGTIALTFDDGPHPEATPQLLDLLDEHAAHATFFVVGRFARAYPAVVRAIGARGHQIGNHTDTHPSLVWRSPRTIAREILRCQDAIADAAGIMPTLFRPPFGFRGPQLAPIVERCGLRRIVMWTVMGRDWTGRPQVVDARLARVRDRDIVVLHDGDHRGGRADRRTTLGCLARWLPARVRGGCRFVALE
jgi:peptidoglycan/xylan/chitin deacetylase (PgdA/CDA1 family)